eukprot:1143644-Pelagomonas_calceolata.AAC.1
MQVCAHALVCVRIPVQFYHGVLAYMRDKQYFHSKEHGTFIWQTRHQGRQLWVINCAEVSSPESALAHTHTHKHTHEHTHTYVDTIHLRRRSPRGQQLPPDGCQAGAVGARVEVGQQQELAGSLCAGMGQQQELLVGSL